MSSKRTDKIDMGTLERNLFFYPREYILNFLIFMTCEYCGKHFFTSKISLFGDYLVCLCPKCGGRHAITINMVGSYRRIKLMTVAALITVLISPLICRLIFVLYYMWIGQ